MNWVKQNYDRFLLAVFSLILLVCAGLLFNNARTYASTFEPARAKVTEQSIIPPVNAGAVKADEQELAKPQLWTDRMIGTQRLPLFVSPPYIAKTTVDATGVAVPQLLPVTGEGGGQIHPPVDNKWLIDHNQDLLSPNVLEQDSDGDGFTTLDEWNWPGHTDPTDKNSHPPYYTKLVLDSLKRIPFRLRFEAKNGDTILINVVDVEDAPTVFCKVGQLVKGTNFKVIKFEAKTQTDKGMVRDVSEVTVENQLTHEQVVLPKQQDVDSPTTYAVLAYKWNNTKFAVKKDGEFSLKPEDNIKYKCLSLSDNQVVALNEKDNKQLIITKNTSAVK